MAPITYTRHVSSRGVDQFLWATAFSDLLARASKMRLSFHIWCMRPDRLHASTWWHRQAYDEEGACHG